jgi:topoisomerase-4 subunit B
MRLQQVTIESLTEVQKALAFYMGKNTPERKDFIVQNLIYETI